MRRGPGLDLSGRWDSFHGNGSEAGDVEEMARDLIAGAVDVEPNSFKLDVRIMMPARAETLRAARSRRAAARLRRAYGISAVDAARLLGVTPGRIYQLLDETDCAFT